MDRSSMSKVVRGNEIEFEFRASVYLNNMISESTSVDQAVACAPVTQRALVQFPVGISFLGRFFRGFSSPVRQMSGSFRLTRSPNIIRPSYSYFHICLVKINGCVDGVYRLWCLCCLGGGPAIELIPHPGRYSMYLSVQKSIYVIPS